MEWLYFGTGAGISERERGRGEKRKKEKKEKKKRCCSLKSRYLQCSIEDDANCSRSNVRVLGTRSPLKSRSLLTRPQKKLCLFKTHSPVQRMFKAVAFSLASKNEALSDRIHTTVRTISGVLIHSSKRFPANSVTDSP